jgi:hypothetical protein
MVIYVTTKWSFRGQLERGFSSSYPKEDRIREQSLLMLGGGRYLWGGDQKFINHLGGLPKISKKGRGGTKNNVQ